MASRQRSGGADSSPGAVALGKHEELPGTAPEPDVERCTCGPKHLRLRSDQGELVTPRGRSVNKCSYCAKLAAVENCEMLVLDALDGDAPDFLMILTTRTATLDMGAFAEARAQMVRQIRRTWPAAEYAYQVEYTTGYGPRSGGLRRPHWNWFWKGIPRADQDQAGAAAIATWCRIVDAEPHGQYAAAIENAVGLTKYVTEHFMKASQRPPAGFTGQRFNCSVGYFGSATRAQARARARDAIAFKRELHKLGQVIDDAHELELAAQLAHRRNLATRWTLSSETGARLGDAVLTTKLTDRLRARAAVLSPPARTTDARTAGQPPGPAGAGAKPRGEPSDVVTAWPLRPPAERTSCSRPTVSERNPP